MPVAIAFRKAVTGAGLALAAVACQSNSTTSENQAASDAAGSNAATALSAGTWRGILSAQGQEIPFLFDVAQDGGKPTVTLRNGEERLKLDEISTAGDSTTIRLGVFDAALVVRPDGTDKLKGAWVKYDGKEPYRVAFTATKGEQPLFSLGNSKAPHSSFKVTGNWATTFQDVGGESYQAVGVFQQNKEKVSGTFLTTTGDYRYLDGVVKNDTLRLSTFDGSHAFLFVAKLTSNAKF